VAQRKGRGRRLNASASAGTLAPARPMPACTARERCRKAGLAERHAGRGSTASRAGFDAEAEIGRA
jgi:hypothetical protein